MDCAVLSNLNSKECSKISSFFSNRNFNQKLRSFPIDNTLQSSLSSKKVKIILLNEFYTSKIFNSLILLKITTINSRLEKESTINWVISNLTWAKYLKYQKAINPPVYKDKIKLKFLKNNSILTMNQSKMLLQPTQNLINNHIKHQNFSQNIWKHRLQLEWKKSVKHKKMKRLKLKLK